MPISKRLRFEVFKRDDFICCYCGDSAPGVVLEVDHIGPKSKGGNDDINNLITACFDCNRGKANIPLEKIPSRLQENLAAIKEKEEQLKEYRKYTKQIERRIRKDIKEIEAVYTELCPGWMFTEQFIHSTIKTFLKLLPKHEIIAALRTAYERMKWQSYHEDRTLKYFCGICWKTIRAKS